MIGDYVTSDIPIKHEQNIQELLRRMNFIRNLWNKPMFVTSGYRMMYDHKRIYSTINAKRIAKGLPEISVPMGSKHLIGQAVDISDPDGSLYDWCVIHEVVLEHIELWCEVKDDQKRVHFQSVPPKSGKRFFIP